MERDLMSEGMPGRGRPRVHANAAERQRAYRQRVEQKARLEYARRLGKELPDEEKREALLRYQRMGATRWELFRHFVGLLPAEQRHWWQRLRDLEREC